MSEAGPGLVSAHGPPPRGTLPATQGADPIFFIALGYGVSYRGWQHLTPWCKVTVDGFFLSFSLISLLAWKILAMGSSSKVHSQIRCKRNALQIVRSKNDIYVCEKYSQARKFIVGQKRKMN